MRVRNCARATPADGAASPIGRVMNESMSQNTPPKYVMPDCVRPYGGVPVRASGWAVECR